MDYSDLHQYQKNLIEYISLKKKCGLFIPMGLGKTIITLTFMQNLIEAKKAKSFIIIAPLRVVKNTWGQEAAKWDHLKDLKFSLCCGNKAQRLKALKNPHNILLINRENVAWLMKMKTKIEHAELIEHDGLIVDESSSFKNPSAIRFKSLKKRITQFKTVILLSGTPSPNSLMDLWSQIYLIDNGERLGSTFTGFRSQYFYQSDYLGYIYKPHDNSARIIHKKIGDICTSFEAKNNLTSIKAIYINSLVDLEPDIMLEYKNFAKKYILELDNKLLSAVNTAVLVNKLLQFGSGHIYDEEKNTHHIHDSKIEVLKDIIADYPNENFLIAYNFKSELTRLLHFFPEAITLSDGNIDDWNDGKIRIYLAHPASCAHGINIQHGGSIIIWFCLTWSLELYQQFNARLVRQGQKSIVRILHIIAKNTIDEKVLSALKTKGISQDGLLNSLRNDIYRDYV